jgi:hypothetical protein
VLAINELDAVDDQEEEKMIDEGARRLESEEDGWTLTVSVNGERDLGGE